MNGNVCKYNFPEDNAVNDPQAVQWIAEFCERYGYGIVVSSTWRTHANYADCLKNAGLRESISILGAIDRSAEEKQAGIKRYISDHPETSIYLIADDDSSFDTFGEHFVLCDAFRGFGEPEFNKAVALHNKLWGSDR